MTRIAESYRYEHPRAAITVDVVLFTVVDTDLKVLLIRRGEPPFAGSWALPGGFVRVAESRGDRGEDLDHAARRELSEETGLATDGIFLEQLYTFGTPNRDPRTRVITVAYYALLNPELRGAVAERGRPALRAGSDASDARWFSLGDEAPRLDLAFDHQEILRTALDRVRGKIDYTPIAFELVPPTFTIAELREVYEAIKGHTYDSANFRRRFQRMVADRILVKAPGKRQTGTKPAKVYRFVRG